MDLNRLMDKYPGANRGDSMFVGSFFTGLSIGFTISYFLLKKRFGHYHHLDELHEIDCSKMSQNDWNELHYAAMQDPIPVKMVGVAVTASTLKENNWNPASSLEKIPAKLPSMKKFDANNDKLPREIINIYDYSNKRGSNSTVYANDFYVLGAKNTNKQVYVKNNSRTQLKGLKYIKNGEETHHTWLLGKLPQGTMISRGYFDLLKHVMVEGEIVSIAGLLTYNVKADEFQMTNPFTIVSGQSETLFKEGVSEYLSFLKKLPALIVITGIIGAFMFYMSYSRTHHLYAVDRKLTERRNAQNRGLYQDEKV